MAIAVVGQRSKRATFECKERRVGAFSRTTGSPGTRNCAHACDPAAADQPYDIHLMCGLIENRTATLRSVEFFRSARAIEIVRVVDRVDHAHAAKIVALYQSAQTHDGPIDGVAMPDDDVTAGAAGPIDDFGALVERERHRLFDQQMFAVLRGKRRMLCMMLMWGRYVDRLDVRIGAQLLGGCVAPGGE